METFRQISILVGVLYILSYVAGILSIAPAVDDLDYLRKSALHSNQTYIASSFQLLMAIFYVGIGFILFPILKIYNETLAAGFLSFRILAVIFILIGTIILLLILKLSQDFVKVNPTESTHYQTIGTLLKTGRDLVNHVGMIVMISISGILLYLIMIQSQLIPNWLSIWGLFGSSLAIIASILVMTKFIDVLTPKYMMLNLPIALQEIFFAGWLIIKGFNKAAMIGV
jgi:hypothetical protein